MNCEKLNESGKYIRSVLQFGLASLLGLLLYGPASSDDGGHTSLPELTGVITIGDLTTPVPPELPQCSDADWPVGAGEFLDIPSFSSESGGPSGIGKMLIEHPDDPLADQAIYVFFSVDDDLLDVDDSLVLMFDFSHDHAVASTASFDESDDRGFQFKRDLSANSVFGNITDPMVNTALDGSRVCVSTEDGEWYIEAKLIPSDLGLNNFNALFGAAVLVDDRSGPGSAFSSWPSGVGPDPLSWANLLTRPPIDFVLVVDQSGSMSGDKWSSAKQAGNNFQAMLSQIHDSALSTEYSSFGVTGGGDRLGLAAFSSSLSTTVPDNSDPDSVDEVYRATISRALTSIDETPADYTGVLPASPGGGTPMADGVNIAFEMFGGADNLGASATVSPANPNMIRRKVVMLLSDGRHNNPSSTLDFDNDRSDSSQNFEYLAAKPACDSAAVVDSLVRVNTAAIGTDGSVDTSKLDQIKDCFSGNRYTNIYNIAGADGPELTATLSRFYFETTYPYYNLNMMTDTGESFDIKAGERKLLLFAFWADTTAVTGLDITKPDGTAESGTCPDDTNGDSLGYCFLLFDNPEAGTYTNYTALGAVGNGRYALLDLRVEAKFALDNQPHDTSSTSSTSSTVVLRGKLREDGVPITGADVRVDVFRPEEGFGTYASTHDPNDCRLIGPTLPDVDPRGGRDAVGNVSFPAFSSAQLNVQATTTSGDVNPPPFALMEAILAACGKDALDRGVDSGLQLFDDGTNGDAVADDGIYTLTFDNTDIEGSHVFRFSANGTIADGTSFARVKEIGEYIRLDVDPGNSPTEMRPIQDIGGVVMEEYSITPRSAGDEYLGPGHVNDISFVVSGATPLGPVLDYNNGIYAQLITYNSGSSTEPEVTVVVQGESIEIDNGRKQLEIVPLLGYTWFDSALSLDDNFLYGAQVNYQWKPSFWVGGELAVTPTETSGGNSGRVSQAFLNGRYEPSSWATGDWQHYVGAGAGYVFFRSFGVNDEAFAVHGNIGSTYKINSKLGLRLEGRIVNVGSVVGVGSSTNYQLTVGLVF